MDPELSSEEDSVLLFNYSFKPEMANARYMCFQSPFPCLLTMANFLKQPFRNLKERIGQIDPILLRPTWA